MGHIHIFHIQQILPTAEEQYDFFTKVYDEPKPSKPRPASVRGAPSAPGPGREPGIEQEEERAREITGNL